MNKLSIIATLMLAVLMLSIAPVFAPIIQPHTADAMWVEPTPIAYTAGPVGTLFNVTVALNMTEDTFAWQAVMYYNHAVLNALTVYKTAPPTSEFFAGHPSTFSSAINPGAYPPIGSLQAVLASETLSSPDFQPGPHWGTLFTVTFNITQPVPKGTTPLTSAFNISYEAGLTNTYVWDPTGNTIPGITFSDGLYTNTWAQPTTKPFMGIEGPSAWPLTYGPGPVVGQTFDVKVYVKQIDPAWFLNNVTFTLTWNSTVIDTLGGLADVTIDPAWTGVVATDIGGVFSFFGVYSGVAPALPNKVLVATLHFTIMTQQLSPPAPPSAVDESYLTFSGVVFWDHTLPIAADTPEQGHVIVGAYVALELPWLQVNPTVTIVGPAPMIGGIFCVNVDVHNLTSAWNTVAIQFRLAYDDTVLQLVSASEGPFMQNPAWDLYGTFFTSINNVGGDFTYPFTHVLVLDLLFPNTTSGLYDQTTFPNAPLTPTPQTPGVNPTVATFCFKVLQQNCFDGANLTTYLNILPFWPPTDNNFIDKDANYIPDLPGVNGTVIIEALNEVDRQIDLVGGSVNDGYGILTGAWPFPYPAPSIYNGAQYLAFPAPYGGQGPNAPMDIVFPQSQIYLNAYVSYNYWPVQSKYAGFEIEGPFIHLANGSYVKAPSYQIWAKLTATTDNNGVATTTFRMPWPCVDPDSITGVWLITSTVTIADQVVTDTMMFYYQRLVYITGVTTDTYTYSHEQCVKVTVNYSTHSIEMYPALFSIVIEDNLTVPFGFATYSTMVGGAVFCTWKNSTFSVTICIPKWAYAGNADVIVSVYDKDPTIGGEAIGPEFTPHPVINITPY